MKRRTAGRPSSSEKVIRDIKRKTRKQYGAEEKIRIVPGGLRGENSIAELCRREGIAHSLKAASEFQDKTTAINQRWQTDFTYLKIIGWGWMYVSTILDDFSRYVIAWKLCTGMTCRDVTETLELEKPDAGRCLLRSLAINTGKQRKDQEEVHRETSFALPTTRRVT